jgi:hypothetical protein
MPPKGVKSPKRKRQYEHIKESAEERGASTKRAKEIAARTVNKQRREAGQTKDTKGTKGTKTRKSTSSRTRSTGSRGSRKR